MTAEISIMNKSAIALAADSAVTMTTRSGKKIFNTVNKLFMLSKCQPVGIMIFGIAEMMSIPWETIIKIYRGQLCTKKFNTLEEYAVDFINFLNTNKSLHKKFHQTIYLKDVISDYYNLLNKKIRDKVEKYILEKGSITELQIKRISTQIIKKDYESWDKIDTLTCNPNNQDQTITKKYKDSIAECKKLVFQNLPLSKSSSDLLSKLVGLIFTKDRFSTALSRIVIAGFGEDEMFPGLLSFYIEGYVADNLKYKRTKKKEINFKNHASIVPFAQSEMVSTFMEGIDPNYSLFIEGYFSRLFLDLYPSLISDKLANKNSNKDELKKKLKEVGKSLLEDLEKDILKYKRSNHIDPILSVVGMLPKDELAAMAESFVNLTSLKRKISLGSETVGGPIDVAVISKGDGFIWIKRKHYFKPEFNQNFLVNYFRDFKEKDQKINAKIE